MSDPICEVPMPEALRQDERLRAQCITGAIPLDEYLQRMIDVGFGTIEIRARRPYRLLEPRRYGVAEPILLESIEIVAYKSPVPPDGACVFTGRSAIWVGEEPVFDDKAGHIIQRDVPLAICDKTAGALEALGLPDLFITPSTWHYEGGGCC
jgi:hypothetical protein